MKVTVLENVYWWGEKSIWHEICSGHYPYCKQICWSSPNYVTVIVHEPCVPLDWRCVLWWSRCSDLKMLVVLLLGECTLAAQFQCNATTLQSCWLGDRWPEQPESRNLLHVWYIADAVHTDTLAAWEHRTESALWFTDVVYSSRGHDLTFGIDRRNNRNTTGDRSTTVHPILAYEMNLAVTAMSHGFPSSSTGMPSCLDGFKLCSGGCQSLRSLIGTTKYTRGSSVTTTCFDNGFITITRMNPAQAQSELYTAVGLRSYVMSYMTAQQLWHACRTALRVLQN